LQSFLFLIIGLEFYAYVVTRQIVNVFEWLVAWRSDKRKAKTYDEWKGIAKQLDAYLGFDEWKESEDDGYFDYSLVSWLSAPPPFSSTRASVCLRSEHDG
jgi:hypothetical protein